MVAVHGHYETQTVPFAAFAGFALAAGPAFAATARKDLNDDQSQRQTDPRRCLQTELAVAMLEAGYQTTMSPKRLRDAVGVALRKGRGQFPEEGGKRAVVDKRAAEVLASAGR